MLTARRLLCAAAVALLCLGGAPRADAAPKIAAKKVLTLDPMLEHLLRFIGGPYVNVVSAAYWNSLDQLTVRRSRVMNASAMQAPLICLDRKQYDDFSGAQRRRSGKSKAERARPVRCLFPDGTRTGTLTQFYGDPANLPYTAQIVMNVLCELLPERFGYFQRRLGEFNARLRSVLISGRRLFAGVRVLCMSKIYRPFFAASGAVVSSPTFSEQYRIRALARAESRQAGLALGGLLRDGRLIVVDWETDVSLRRGLTAFAGAVYLRPPRDEDLLFYIHHMILIMGSRLEQMK